MMLTRFVRVQLAVFIVAALLGITVMLTNYIQLPTLLGIGRITVTLELPEAGGLYRFANVTYRGMQMGKVTSITANRAGATATLSLQSSPRVPADLRAEVRSVSAVGEQYVELRPRTEAPPYLHDGSVIDRADIVMPQPVAPMVDQVGALIATISTDRLGDLLDESFNAFNGAGPDLRALLDSSATLADGLNELGDKTTRLIEDSAPVLDAQLTSADSLRQWSADLAGISAQLVANDPQIRTLLETGSGAADSVTHLLDEVKPTLPVLLANLTTVGQIAVTYRPGLQQLLVLLPPTAAYYQAENWSNSYPGMPLGDFRISIDDPPACTVGFLPQSQWRSPADTSTLDTPDGLYCKLPQDSPIAVRGARNYPCMTKPGKFAPTVQQCRSDEPFKPLSMRQHALGPNPIDPNLIAQGIAPDNRVSRQDNIFAPIAGTPPEPVPPVAIAHYDPATGRFATPDGTVLQQTDLAPGGTPKSLAELMLVGGS